MLDFRFIDADSHVAEHPAAWARVQREYGDRARMDDDVARNGFAAWAHRGIDGHLDFSAAKKNLPRHDVPRSVTLNTQAGAPPAWRADCLLLQG